MSEDWYNVRSPEFGAVGDGITDDTSAFEMALGAAKVALGGVVYVPAGIYLIRRSLYLASGVVLRGAGSVSRITKPASVKSMLALNATGGDSVCVEDSTNFEVGDSLYLADISSYEWKSTKAVITSILGNIITLDKPITWGLKRYRFAFATTSFPLLRNEQDGTHNIVVRDLLLDHNKSSSDPNNDFTLGTIHFEGSFNSLVENVWFVNSPADAYSDQGFNALNNPVLTADDIRRTVNTIRGSHFYNIGRHGVHLGTCMEGASVLNNDIENCAGFAVFYCAFATHNIISGNQVKACQSGFAGLDYRDVGNIISENVICDSLYFAIEAANGNGSGGHLVISNNIISGRGIYINQPDCVISDNLIDSKIVTNAISVGTFGARALVLGNNIISTGAGGSVGVYLAGSSDCRIVSNIIKGPQVMVSISGCSNMVALGNVFLESPAYYWKFVGPVSTDCVIKDERNVAGNPVTEVTPTLRLVYEGYGDNGENDPATSGDWHGIVGRRYNGTLVKWTAAGVTNVSIFVGGLAGWLKIT